MISVDAALARIVALLPRMPVETVPLRAASGRWMAEPVAARLTQPPFDASSMDGYAVRDADIAPGAVLTVTAEAQAGRRADMVLHPGESIRIFTGAPMPEGADRVVIQEDVTRDGDRITLHDDLDTNRYVRPAGADFREGDSLAPGPVTPQRLALLAAMNVAQVPVARRPTVALISTGDELVVPGDTPGPDQIVSSNIYGVAALMEAAGATPRILPIARDTAQSLRATLDLARDADLIVTLGGASVGDHDLVAKVGGEAGLDLDFYKVAMRPGKPLMAGRFGESVLVGLPGNPVSAMVCAHIFLRPAIAHMLGGTGTPLPRHRAALAAAIGPNGGREHYMRATRTPHGIEVATRQDSALLTVLDRADCLVVRPPHDPAREAGEEVDYIELDRTH
ncbi:gephyrin-like molybdotransferase Glp [Roseobacter sp. HKCCA0434]|uniref:molybdopterin molybdotransferase MoeA n=1 Tax=Roseobacter sp. HKCCA0434 TaxID=3079297 RepID=UPI002905C064|nr:gephyrin-like molybdotransferase Glp [Roseobacter sp. HKCCA0434]